MTSPAVIRITDVAVPGQFNPGGDDAITIGICLDIVEGIGAMAVFANANLCFKGEGIIVTPETDEPVGSHSSKEACFVVGVFVRIYQDARWVIYPGYCRVTGSC